MKNFVMLWGKTLDSSIWRRESKETKIVWMTLLMMKDADGMVYSSLVGLADRAVVTDAECLEALRVLLSPDSNDTSKVEQGRRIREVPGGWQIVNHDLYRFSTAAKREFWATAKAEQRASKGKPKRSHKAVRAANESRERRFVEAENNGDQQKADAIAAEGLG